MRESETQQAEASGEKAEGRKRKADETLSASVRAAEPRRSLPGSLPALAALRLPSSAYFLPLAAFCLLLAVFCFPPSAFTGGAQTPGQKAPEQDASLLETGSPSKPVPAPALAPTQLKIVSYNIRWRGGEDLRKLIEQLRDDAEIGQADIVGLQEVDRHRKRTDNVNTVRAMAESLGMYYAWAAPPYEPEDEEEPTGVAILSRYPLKDVERIVLPNEGPNRRRRAAVGATIQLGAESLRVYSVHAETRIKMEKKMEQLSAVLESLARYPKIERAIVLGDFNTIKEKDVRGARKLFTDAGFQTPLPDDRETFKTFIFEFKLDWIWLRGIEAGEGGVVRRLDLSDHWPVWVKAKLNPKPLTAERR